MAATITEDAIQKAQDRFPNLETVVAMRTWPTPNASQPGQGDPNDPKRGKKLWWAVNSQTWPTPSANEDAAGTVNGKMQAMLGNHPDVRSSGDGSLSPDWVELLMGWPAGWTSLDPMTMDEWTADWPETWEDGVPRVAVGVKHRVHRLKALGNGQVPLCAAVAWVVLGGPA